MLYEVITTLFVGARILALLGDSITTDHISPAGSIRADSPAGTYLQGHGVAVADFNSYGSRRGNHEVMMRGTFANIRLRNEMVPQLEGGYTRHIPSGTEQSIYDAAMRYAEEGTPLVVVAGKEYGTRITSYNVCYTKLLRRLAAKYLGGGRDAGDVCRSDSHDRFFL